MSQRYLIVALALGCASAFAQSSSSSATYNSANGPVTVHSGQPTPRDYGPPPAFATLDHRNAGFLTSDDAEAYPPLANDFLYADSNRDGRISKKEYERWARAGR